MSDKMGTTIESVGRETPLIAFYQWLLKGDVELNNILSLFEYKERTLCLKQKKENAPPITLETLFNELGPNRSWDANKDILRQIFFAYYNTTSLVHPEPKIALEIATSTPFVKECLRRMIEKEQSKQGKGNTLPDRVSVNVNNITKARS